MRMLPDFNEPPVIETVLGLQFDSLESFSIPHFGLYWSKILPIIQNSMFNRR